MQLLQIHKGYFVVEKAALNVGFKAFWYTHYFDSNKNLIS